MKFIFTIKRISFLFAFITLSGISITNSQELSDEFIPQGSPFVKIYSNFHYELNSGETAIEIERAYFGYKYQMSENFSGKLNIDVGAPVVNFGDTLTNGNTSLEMTAYLKNAALKYHKGKLTIDFGLIRLKHFKIQENLWGHRYIYKSFKDENKYSPSADLGAILLYKIHKMFSFDVTVRNGEGYKNLQSDNSYLTGLGLTLKPINGLTIRAYYDYLKTTEAQVTVSHFVGYEINKLKIGAEYDLQYNHTNVTDLNLSGISIYSSYDITVRLELFVRFDQLSSEMESHKPYPGSTIIGGVQLTPVKNVKIALNYQGFIPGDKNKDDKNVIYLNFLYSF